jgi:enamine deaminase RidA (YjgF/YER057c/UK114 family)
MKRTQVNPWDWSLQFGFSQGELVEGGQRVLFCAGQTALDENAKPQHEGDIRAQTTAALDNLETVLKDAGMTLSNVVRLHIYTTDVDTMIQNYDALVGRLEAAGIKPAQTLLGVNRLAFPELLVEIEATAVA